MPPKNGRRPRPLVMVLDEHKHARVAFRFYLNHEGYDVVEAASGQEAAEVARAHAPDLVIVDLNMPGVGGVLAAQRLRAIAEVRDVPFVACAGPDSQAYRDAARAAGCDAYVTKPFNPGILLMVVKRLLNRRSAGVLPSGDVAQMAAMVM
jgi:two-component system cell cycle response regulator DivK